MSHTFIDQQAVRKESPARVFVGRGACSHFGGGRRAGQHRSDRAWHPDDNRG